MFSPTLSVTLTRHDVVLPKEMSTEQEYSDEVEKGLWPLQGEDGKQR